jgi:hypothetical protein
MRGPVRDVSRSHRHRARVVGRVFRSGRVFVVGTRIRTADPARCLDDLERRRRYAAIAGHEHYVGSAVEITIQRAHPTAEQPANECLLSIPQWDFNWQRIYSYDATLDQVPVANPGDVVQIKCTYNNTFSNPFEVQSLLDQGLSMPITVKLGETTLDEMCLGAFLVTY